MIFLWPNQYATGLARRISKVVWRARCAGAVDGTDVDDARGIFSGGGGLVCEREDTLEVEGEDAHLGGDGVGAVVVAPDAAGVVDEDVGF